MAEWDIQDVCQGLKDIGLGEHASMFEENEIIGEHLLDFGKDDLRELGVKKPGHQKTFISKLNLPIVAVIIYIRFYQMYHD